MTITDISDGIVDIWIGFDGVGVGVGVGLRIDTIDP